MVFVDQNHDIRRERCLKFQFLNNLGPYLVNDTWKYGKTSHFLFLFSFFNWHNPILYMKMSVFQFQEQIKVWMILGLLATNNHLPRLKTIMVLVKESRKIRKYPKNKNTQNLLSRKKVVPRSFYAWLKTHDHSIWFNSTTV